ncbi:hypothetical protein [Streptococcus loxodontisalivarius]|uniref:Membrane associated protein n=1 Tax=Streptococcus loxodontisalivarius TaxID=1349415 RepID=A0ABS2PRS4_9STRE|nr:hypothetical protein [Streptococcus loxodontisalivarius]MBM7642736.1 hypothetical protein [Streptococcus loxodontisalivarius]
MNHHLHQKSPNERTSQYSSDGHRKPTRLQLAAVTAITLAIVYLFEDHLVLLVAVIALITIIYFGITYYQIQKQKSISLQLQTLKDHIRQADRATVLLEDYLEEQDYPKYAQVAQRLLPQLQKITTESDEVKKHIEASVYDRLINKLQEIEEGVREQLNLLHLSTSESNLDIVQRLIAYAPELLISFQNIQRDHLIILTKIEQAPNRAELLALHDINMERFQDILEGYLKIKANPKNYYDSEQRLAQAKNVIEQFDLDLDETLRRLNENDLSDFEISLRMMMNNDDKDFL